MDRIGRNIEFKQSGRRPAALSVSLALVFILSACTSQGDRGEVLSTSQASNANRSVQPSNSQQIRVVSALPINTDFANAGDQPIAKNDLLEVDVFRVDDLDKTVRVDSRGFISLPLIGQVEVAGKSASQVELELENRYGKNYLQSPEINVFVKESAGQQMTLDGEFKQPGVYATTSQTTLLRAVAQAGGLSQIADEKKVFVYRNHNSQKLVANYDLKSIREGKVSDPRIQGGDTIIAFTSDAKIAAENLKQALGIASSAARVATPF